MAILPIRIFGDPILRQVANEVTEFNAELSALADDMIETMHAAHGAGLAAPQVGVLKRLFVYDVGEGAETVVNPRLSDPVGEFTYDEGCLSLPGIFVEITRPDEITCDYRDVHGEPRTIRADQLLGRVFQHESLHLDGRWFFYDAPRANRKEALKAMRENLQSGETMWTPDPSEHHDHEEATL